MMLHVCRACASTHLARVVHRDDSADAPHQQHQIRRRAKKIEVETDAWKKNFGKNFGTTYSRRRHRRCHHNINSWSSRTHPSRTAARHPTRIALAMTGPCLRVGNI